MDLNFFMYTTDYKVDYLKNELVKFYYSKIF